MKVFSSWGVVEVMLVSVMLVSFMALAEAQVLSAPFIKIEGASFLAVKPGLGILHLEIRNDGANEDELIDISTSTPKITARPAKLRTVAYREQKGYRVEIERRAVGKILLAPSSTSKFPGTQAQLLLENIPDTAQIGDSFMLTLRFRSGGEPSVKVVYNSIVVYKFPENKQADLWLQAAQIKEAFRLGGKEDTPMIVMD